VGTLFVQVLEVLMQKTNLTQVQTEEVMETLLADANPAVIGAFLALLRAKGETLEEVRTPCNIFAEQRLIYTAYNGWEVGMACLYFEISNHFGS
jgi:anthranilate phosphoribosyltransferase